MTSYSLSHLADGTLLHNLTTLVSQDRATTAALLAHLAEVDERKLFVPAAYDSMHAYCVHELHMSEDIAYKRIQAARAARRYSAIFPALADGRLHLTAVVLLAPHLTPDTADELLVAATHKTKPELEQMIAARFPRPDLPTVVQAVAPATIADGLAVGPAERADLQLVPEPVAPSAGSSVTGPIEPLLSRSRLAPLSLGRFALQVTVDQETHDQLRYAQALLGHAVPSGDVAEVLKRALNSLVNDLEKRKFAKCTRPLPQRGAAKGRHIPAAVRRTVCQRDGGQCTFVSELGKRCEARSRLELDHILPAARGGQTISSNLRLRCRVHNQHAADCVYGPEFMRGKREQARVRTAEAGARLKAQAEAKARAEIEAESTSQEEVIPWLRALGCNAETARRAAARCAGMVGAPLEKRVRVAVQGLGPRAVQRMVPAVTCQT
jgi:hypothetical protein